MEKIFSTASSAPASSARTTASPHLAFQPSQAPLVSVPQEQWRELQTQSDDLQSILEELDLGLVICNDRFVIKRVQGPVRLWLQQFFGTSLEERYLPEALENWLREPIGGTIVDRTRFYETEERQLWVQLTAERRPGEFCLLLRERPRPGSRQSLEQLGLTGRETEVLCWLAQGKSNPEIGRILGIASRTVHKHLERIYAHLGVENRTAAAVRALETV
jgi:DNA-binding CsgD family transcriptional regulator